MAEWIPSFEVAGGLYAGRTPSGNLEGFLEHILNLSGGGATVDGFRVITNSAVEHNPDYDWQGAYGSSDEAFKTYGRQHSGQGFQDDIPMMIFTISNPENAPWYKQELAVYGGEEYTLKHGGTAGEPDFFIVEDYDFRLVRRIVRREYATPYSTPVITHTFYTGNIGAGSLYYPVSGTPFGPESELVINCKLGTSYAVIDDFNYLCFYFYAVTKREQGAGGQPSYQSLYNFVGIRYSVLVEAFGGDFGLDSEDDPYIDPDPPEPGDNPPPTTGDHEKDYDPIPLPPMPDLTALGAGFLSLYSPSAALLNLFADELYSDSILQIISNYFTNVADMIAGMAIIPFHVPTSGYFHHRVGLFTTDVALPRVSSQFIDIDCGSIEVKPYYNSFLDQAGNTKILVWLPYIGYQELNTDEVMGQTLSIKYRCDILSGACVAFVIIGNSESGYTATRIIAQFAGNVLTQIPSAAASYDSMVSSAINILTATVGVAAMGGVGGAGIAAGGMKEASNITSAVVAQVGLGMAGTASNSIMAMKPNVIRNGTMGTTAGYLGVQKPYLIKIVPRSAVAPNHIQLKGYPSNYGGTLNGLSGYCEVSEIMLQNCPAEVDEKTEIYSLLKGGVIV